MAIAEVAKRLKKALEPYADTARIVNQLIETHKSPQVVILLVCARLDSLANLAFHSEDKEITRFCRFLRTYSGEDKFFSRISVGELYRFFAVNTSGLDGTLIEKPGRFMSLNNREEKLFIDFVKDSEVAITARDIQQLAKKISTVLKRRFDVRDQSLLESLELNEDRMPTEKAVQDAILSHFKRPDSECIRKAIMPILREFRADTILYRKYRCKVVHGFGIDIDEEVFFSGLKPFFCAQMTQTGEPFLELGFPGPYLAMLLLNCLKNYTRHLEVKQRFPWDLHHVMFSTFDADARKYLDTDSL